MRTDVKVSSVVLGRARPFAALLCVLCALCLLCSRHAAAQDDSRPAGDGAMKFDEYGNLPHCDLTARLDNLANLLQENPNAAGYIVTYDAAKGRPGFAKYAAEWQMDYLVNSRGVAPERIVAFGAGRYQGEELKTELWVVPPGAKAPAEAAPPDAEPPFSGRYATSVMQYDTNFDDAEEMPTFNSMSVVRRAFAGLLRKQPKSKAYLVAYADAQSTPGTWRRLATIDKLRLEELGVEPSRLEIVNGGTLKKKREYEMAGEVELWIVPEDAPPPVKAKKREKRLREAAMIGSYTHYDWKEEAARERTWLLENLAQMLREDAGRVGCLVVFRDDSPPEFDEVSGEVKTPFDYVALAGELRRELRERYRIEEHRFVLLVGAAGEWQGSSLETWIVPKGVALPDPAEIVRRRAAEMEAGEDGGDAEKP
ncbi:MAG TPA: hypothetical protein VK421_02200 [Pyrinomonadaceae bacterium]|nr:hypothetical protein [Pyrinomonadaceae bacterium]